MTSFASRWRSPSEPAETPDAELAEAVVEELTEPVVTMGSDGLVRSNRRARELHGLPRGPLPRDRWAARHRLFARGADRAFAPEELPLVRAMTGEEVSPVEVEIRDRKGAAEPFVVSAHPIRRGGRGVIGALSILLPQSRREQESRFPSAEVLQHAADGIAVISASTGAFIYTNDAWSHALGYGPGELTGRHVSSVNAPSDRLPQELAAEMLQVLERGGSWRGEVELRRRDGSAVWWEQTVSRYDDELGRPAWIMVGRDIGARRSGAGELRDAERRFRTAFDALPVAAALTDADGRLLAVNDELAARAGARREELLGRALDAVVEPVDPEHAGAVAAAARRGGRSRYRVDARCGGRGESVAVTTTIVRDVDGRPLHAVAVVEPVQPASTS